MKFKTTKLYFALFFLATMQLANATDLIVRDGGAGGAFATISDAINAATDGDRIIIRPKVGDTPYIEDLTIDKSLTLLSEISGDKYEILGTITINNDVNRTVSIHNASTTGDIVSNGTISGGRMFINIINSESDESLLLSEDNVTVNVVRTTCNRINFRHGKVVANNCSKILMTDDVGDSLATDDVYIIANRVSAQAAGFTDSPALIINSLNYTFHVLNNSLVNGIGHSTVINGVKDGTTNFISNNFIKPVGSNFRGLRIATEAIATIVIRNNLFDPVGSDEIEVINNAIFVIAQYNMTRSTTFDITNADVNENNVSGATYDVTTFTGDNENAGHPDAIFTDIDLTRNDMGPKGGSYNWDNYRTADDTKPHVFFLQTPRRIFNGTTSFEANGSAKSN
ncbi:hypothetical protein [uncultured Algibacter sp.]|uniref:hypothetical protein n=1 Tax=uncultured Algibacter sp. TaxID=298659 RepID=UPI00321651B0